MRTPARIYSHQRRSISFCPPSPFLSSLPLPFLSFFFYFTGRSRRAFVSNVSGFQATPGASLRRVIKRANKEERDLV